ncbi:MAG TPA: single-stranded-DNA-specific exonuclease RecJ [Candidatus Moranbacteria bacterium]|nr:single-stranded-DNA-specific exonuclease RecJ [Candidatus Moranbacteria bacterium]
MKKNWKIKKNELKAVASSNEKIITSILLNRGLTTEEEKNAFLFPDYERDLHDPFLIKDMQKAVDRVLLAKKRKERICIYGDYDADGVTATVLVKDFFNQIELDFFCYIPDKDKEGNSLNKEAIDYIKTQGANLIITVDCGISSFKEVAYANENEIEVIITDHHSLPKKLPAALAIINPKASPDYPEKNLAGVGVAFKFVAALAGSFEEYEKDQLKWLLDLVAIGTIADCVPLIGENRTLAKFGLLVLSKTRRVGLKQIFQVGSLNINSGLIPSAEQISFQLAPRINAAGRIDHANLAFDLLSAVEGEESSARILALELESKNQHRQKITEKIISEVENRLKNKNNLPAVIVEWAPHWSYGIVGLVAGKIAEKYHRPTLILQEKDSILRGSGRSVPEVNFIEILRESDHLMSKYGGHSQALGGEFPKKNVEELSRNLEKKIAPLLKKENISELEIDTELTLAQINFDLVNQLSQLEPFGEGNPEPIFLTRNLTVSDLRLVGNGEKHLKLILSDGEPDTNRLSAIGFRLADNYANLKINDKIDLVFTLQKNQWNGIESIQAKIIDLNVIS